MNLTVYANDDELFDVDEIMDNIKVEKKWRVLGYHDEDGTRFDIETAEGRAGTYDVTGDILIWNDDEDETEYNLFGNDVDVEWIAYSLAEFIGCDGATGVWGDGDDGCSYYWLNN